MPTQRHAHKQRRPPPTCCIPRAAMRSEAVSATLSWPMNDAEPEPPGPPRMTWTRSAAISKSRIASSTDCSASPTRASASSVGDPVCRRVGGWSVSGGRIMLIVHKFVHLCRSAPSPRSRPGETDGACMNVDGGTSGRSVHPSREVGPTHESAQACADSLLGGVVHEVEAADHRLEGLIRGHDPVMGVLGSRWVYGCD